MSAILKQNGTDGKILRNSDGKVLKQNYNFGNACTEVISIPFLEERTIDDVFTVELWHKSNSASSRDSLVVADWDSDYIDHWLEYSSLRHRFRYGGALSTITSVPVSLGMYVTQEINLLSDGVAEVNNEYTATNNSLSSQSGSTISRFEIGGTGTLSYADIDGKNSVFRYYNRALADSEKIYNYNNGLGNEPLSCLDLLVYFKFEAAEIIDFGGDIGEVVAVRDYSGNDNHGIIENLPDGTTEEQLEYANSNLFEKW